MITAEERAKWRSEHAGCVRSGLTCLSAVVRLLDELETAERELSLARAVVEAITGDILECHPHVTFCGCDWCILFQRLAAYDAREVQG
jgi:hypothetical protein